MKVEGRGRGAARSARGRGAGKPFGARPSSSSSQGANGHQQSATGMHAPIVPSVPLETELSSRSFASAPISPILMRTILDNLKFDKMTPVQAATLDDLLQKQDCLVQAKTGTGKTLAFLIPAIEEMIKSPVRGISLLVITPTRELAQQIAKEAAGLLQNLPKYRIGIAIGGTNKDKEQRVIRGGRDILIATPGRLIDHLDEETVVDQFQQLKTLVLDEADRLLDMGFMPSLQQIVRALPDKQKTGRQGMLFSATIAAHVQKVAGLVLSPGYKFISTIPEGESNTHERVPQMLVTVPLFTDVAPAMIAALHHECTDDTFKAIVFAPTAAMADWYGAIIERFKTLPPVSVLHSRISQSKRTSITNAFRGCKAGILVATDVIARGIDFPDVSDVFQVGIPAAREDYIHRLGRTARAGKEGRGILIVAEPETFFPRFTLKDIQFQQMPVDSVKFRREVDQQAQSIGGFEKPYQAWMGYYKNHLRAMKWDTAELVRQANTFAIEALKAPEVPSLQRKIIGKMGLKGVPGLNIRPNDSMPSGARGGGEGRSGGSGGRGGRR
ncbi:P-loop containing nucleoside triphosphate hydrolase protein [Protomyces lactucae-debilis]|uniref:ATP-dependent RNA helicase n=1 Tax=Protomyces lactucae-debilis TaxID=2754530 RepID=A0A1Y2EXG1_PROLT|nr:P-loop containing nucleoside triphosphate hydrolase protein [Protomyces lactucae-debilis]ORY76302.1 P-loop containing nucleoside triphosphate hydrolase protein [Protomyces lactucae-debilis]